MMDNLRGHFPEPQAAEDDTAWDADEDAIDIEAPPRPVGQEERRMQVRAYNHWVGLLGPRQYPAIGQLKLEELHDFGPHAVLLDLREDIENPAISYIGAALRHDFDGPDCDAKAGAVRLADVPSRSLLSRITDHYMQILANQAPIGFEAEFTDQRGKAMLYRGILLPFSDDDRVISHILGVINGKYLAEAELVAALELELAQVLLDDEEAGGETLEQAPPEPASAPLPGWLVEWADGSEIAPMPAPQPHMPSASVSDLPLASDPPPRHDQAKRPPASWTLGHFNFPAPGFGQPSAPAPRIAAAVAPTASPARAASSVVTPVALINALAAARAGAQALREGEAAQTAQVLALLGYAYDLALAAAASPEAFAGMLAEAGLKDDAAVPAIAALRLAFGPDYPQHIQLGRHTLLIEHALRLGLPAGSLVPYLTTAPGGLEGLLAEARRLRRIADGQFTPPAVSVEPALAARLDGLPGHTLADLPAEGAAYSVLIARRGADGAVTVLGEITDDALLAEAARRLI